MVQKLSEGIGTVVDHDGTVCQLQSLDDQQALLRLENGRLVSVPATMLEAQSDGHYRLTFNLNRFLSEDVMALPVTEEQITVDKQAVVNKVRISKTIQTEDVQVNQLLTQDTIQIDHVPINQYVDAPTPVRHEGDTIIIPLLEEVLVVEKRLLLREEIRISRQQTTTNNPQTYTLRREDIQVQREDDPSLS